MAKDAEPKGKWYPCGARQDVKSGKFVRGCSEHPEHQVKPDKK